MHTFMARYGSRTDLSSRFSDLHDQHPPRQRHPLDNSGRTVRCIYQVIDGSDGDAVVTTYRNEHLANVHARTSPAYSVRPIILD